MKVGWTKSISMANKPRASLKHNAEVPAVVVTTPKCMIEIICTLSLNQSKKE